MIESDDMSDDDMREGVESVCPQVGSAIGQPCLPETGATDVLALLALASASVALGLWLLIRAARED